MDAKGINRGLATQVATLKEVRRVEAAELERIIAEIEAGGDAPSPQTEEA
jgi:hypothetical protein